MSPSDVNGKVNHILPIVTSDEQKSKFQQLLRNGGLIPGHSLLDLGGVGGATDGKIVAVNPGLDVAAAVRQNGQRRTRKLQTLGDKPILVVKVTDSDDVTRPESAAEISDDIFGTLGDPVNLKSQMAACSFGQLNIIPGTIEPASLEAAPGVIEVTIPVSFQSGDKYHIQNEITDAVQSLLGITLPGPYEQVMYVMDSCLACNYVAYAYANSWLSVYRAGNYKKVAVQMHGEYSCLRKS